MAKEIRNRLKAMNFIRVFAIEGEEITDEQNRAIAEKVLKYSAGWKRYGGNSRRMHLTNFLGFLKSIDLEFNHICGIVVFDERCPVDAECVKGVCRQIVKWLNFRREYWKSSKVLEITGGRKVNTY
jgi:hypothetical protein